MAFATSTSGVPLSEYPTLKTNINTFRAEQQQPIQGQQQLPTQVSTKALAITSCASAGSPPPPLIGSAIVLANDSAMHCFGGRLENRNFTNCHYVLDLETGIWETIHAAPVPAESTDATGAGNETATGDDTNKSSATSRSSIEKPANISLSLTTDPVDTDSSLISGEAPIQPRPRYFHTLNAFGTSLILFGGMGKVQDGKEKDEQNDSAQQAGESETGNQGALEALNDLWVFDIISQKWQQKHPPVNNHSPRSRWAHMATILDHYLVVIGGTDTLKVYIEDACILDLHTWEWVATVQSIGQCGSYRTVAATGPSKQSSNSTEPVVSSFPSANASSPQTSTSLARPVTDSGPVDAMASISMVLSGRISAPSSTTSSKIDDVSDTSASQSGKRKTSERLLSGELTPAFRTGKDVPSIYLYSNYNFTNLRRDFKVITPHYTHPNVAAVDTTLTTLAPMAPPSFSLIEKSQALNMMGPELPPGLRFPQGHVYQNQLILTGTLIVPNKAPTMAIYTFNLTHYKWIRLDTDTLLEAGSWNRTLLHPATGTLLVFGNHETDPKTAYASRLQHHDHFMLIDLQAYGLYDRPIPSLPQAAQDLGHDLLSHSSLCDMHVSSATGTMFGANSTILAARWPEFSSLLLSPPYVTPLILELPVPDEVVQVFLQYLYTGALPSDITAGIADYLLILARKYELNGLYALTMDVLHQMVHLRPVRTYSTALLAGELGLQARAVGMAMPKLPARLSQDAVAGAVSNIPASAIEGKELPPLPSPVSTSGSSLNFMGLGRSYSGRVPPPPPPPSNGPYMNTHRRELLNQSRESLSTDGGFVAEGLLQQYNGGQRQLPGATLEDDIGIRRQISLRSPPLTGGRGFDYDNLLISTEAPQGYNNYNMNSYPSPLSPTSSYSSQQISLRGYGQDDPQDERTIQAKRRLQMQMRQDPDIQLPQHHPHYPQHHQDYLQHQQLSMEQQHMRDRETVLLEQHRLQHQRYLQRQQSIQVHQLQVEQPNSSGVVDELDYHFGGGIKQPSTFRIRSPNESMRIDTSSSQQMRSGGSKSEKEKEKEKEKERKKEKNLMSKMKPPKSSLSGAELMKSAGF